MSDDSFPQIVELNVGGVFYTTSLTTLTREPDSLLGQLFTGKSKHLVKDNKGKYFLDRDGVLFRYVLDYLRNQSLVLPENFHEKERLRQEAEHFKLPAMVKAVNSAAMPAKLPPLSTSNHTSGNANSVNGDCIVVGYRGTFAFGRDGLADVKFRKLARILVSGRVSVCREVFQDTLNENRDPDRGSTDRFTARYYLKHMFLEQAFENLLICGFRMVGSCGSGTNGSGEMKPGMESEEHKWNHFNEFIFVR